MNSHQWIGVKQVHERLGGAIGEHEIRRLMKANHIRSWWVRGKLVTSVKECEDWMKRVENADRTAQQFGAPYITPVAAILS